MTALPASLGAAGNGPTSPPSRALSVGAALPAGSTHLAVAALPHPRTVPHRMLSGGLVIDPNASYTSEPAPMGITDYGVTPSGVGYSYATPVVQGSATIDSFAVADGSSGTNMTFQLNVEDVVVSGSSSFVFWVQDVAFFDTQSHLIFWEDNVWNLTGGTGNLYTSSVAGNGTVYSSYYYADVANGYPGPGSSSASRQRSAPGSSPPTPPALPTSGSSTPTATAGSPSTTSRSRSPRSGSKRGSSSTASTTPRRAGTTTPSGT